MKPERIQPMKPILFSTQMVQAILAGNKTMTRRIIKPQPLKYEYPLHYNGISQDGTFHLLGNEFDGYTCFKSKYQPGDILWVRETWENFRGGYNYKADEYGLLGEQWKPSIFMPRVAARIFLEVTNVKAERLQDINQNDIIQEGVCSGKKFMDELCIWRDSKYAIENLRIHTFKTLWESINGKGSWELNPWVWVYSFNKLKEL